MPLDLVPSEARSLELIAKFGMGNILPRPGRPGVFRVKKGRAWVYFHDAAEKRELELARSVFAKMLSSAESANDLRRTRELEQVAGVRSARPRDVAEVPILDLTGTRPK